MRIACVGSREIPGEVADACREMGAELARAGYSIVTGATPGTPGQDEWVDWADGAFATGAYYADPTCIIVCLPWHHFPHGSSVPPDLGVQYFEGHPEWADAAAAYWAARRADEAGPWASIRRANRLRLVRNAGIILQSRLALAWPHGEAEGTRFAMDFADWRGVPVIDLSQLSWQDVLAALLAQAAAHLLPEKSNQASELSQRYATIKESRD